MSKIKYYKYVNIVASYRLKTRVEPTPEMSSSYTMILQTTDSGKHNNGLMNLLVSQTFRESQEEEWKCSFWLYMG
jgi:hypothetical protein